MYMYVSQVVLVFVNTIYRIFLLFPLKNMRSHNIKNILSQLNGLLKLLQFAAILLMLMHVYNQFHPHLSLFIIKVPRYLWTQ